MTGVVEDDPAETFELVRTGAARRYRPHRCLRRLSSRSVGDAAAVPAATTGHSCTKSYPVITEHTVSCRCASIACASTRSCMATDVAATLCDDPVSTTKLWRGPSAKRTTTLSETSPGSDVTVKGTVDLSPWVSATGGGPGGPVKGVGAVIDAPSAPGRTREPAAKSTRTAPEAGRKDVGADEPHGLPLPADLGQRGGRQLLGHQRDPVKRPRLHRHGLGRARAPHPGELGPGPGRREMESPGQAGVDRRLTGTRVEDERNGPWPPMQTLTVSATCPATVLTVSGTRVVPPGCPSPVAPSRVAGA